MICNDHQSRAQSHACAGLQQEEEKEGEEKEEKEEKEIFLVLVLF